MTAIEFRIAFSQAVAEDDFPLCDTGSAYCADLSNAGLTRLTDIAETAAEPLFKKIAELKARTVELEAALVETIEDATEGTEKHIQRAEKAEARIKEWEAQARRADTALADLEAETESLRAALERIENAAIEKGGDALPYIIAEAQTILEGRAEAAEARINELEAKYCAQVHSDIATENNLLRCQAEARAEVAEREREIERLDKEQLYGATEIASQTIRAVEAENDKLRDILTKVEVWFASEDGPIYKLWEDLDICNYDNRECEWEEALAEVQNLTLPASAVGYGTEWPAVTLYREILAALCPAAEQPDCDHPFRVTGDVCLNCGEWDEQPTEAQAEALRAALEAVVKLRNGSRLYFVLNHHNGVTEELLRPEDRHTDMIVAALSLAVERPAESEGK